MKDEIKEILYKLKDSTWEKDTEEICYKILFSNEVYKLLDYITNLQESEAYYYGQYKDYKSINEKAIEFNQIVLDSDYVYSQDEIAQKNLNILNGGDDNE